MLNECVRVYARIALKPYGTTYQYAEGLLYVSRGMTKEALGIWQQQGLTNSELAGAGTWRAARLSVRGLQVCTLMVGPCDCDLG